MSIASEIQRLQTAKADIKTAIQGEGVTVPSNAKLDTYDNYISAISNFKYAISGKFQPSSDSTSYTLSNLSLGGLTPKVIIFNCNSASNWRSSTEYIISACYVTAGSSSSITTTFCTKFYSQYVRGYAESNGSNYVSFSRSANAVTISTANSAKIASGKSYQYIILA